jgi:hypothetical protein
MATRAEIAAELSLSITPFQRALAHATANAKEFAEKAGETGKEVEKGLLGKDLSTMLGIGGATLALGLFADKLREFVGDAIKDFGKMESATLRLALALHNPALAAQLAEEAEKHAGVAGTSEEIIRAQQAGITAGLRHDPSASGGNEEDRGSSNLPGRRHAAPEAGGENFIPGSLESTMRDLGNLHVVNQKSVAEMMDAVRAFTVKGGEGKSMNKMINAIPELEPIILARIKASGLHQTPEEWGKSHIKSLSDLTGLIHATAASYTSPGGKDPMAQAKDTLEGEISEFKARLSAMNAAIGKDLAPDLKQIITDFQADIPAITKVLDTSFRGLASFIDDMLTGHGIFKISSTPDMANPLNQVQKWWTTNVLPETQKNSDAGLLKDIHDAIEKTNEIIGKTVKDSPLIDVF